MCQMNQTEFEQYIVELISVNKSESNTFTQHVKALPNLFQELDDSAMINLCDMYAEGNGPVGAWQFARENGYQHVPRANFHDTKDLSNRGLYVLYSNGVPFYAGIGKNVFKRLRQHSKSKGFGSSSILLRLAKEHHVHSKVEYIFKKNGEGSYGVHGEPAHDWLIKQSVKFILIDNWELLYLFELYVAMRLGTVFNSFETH